MFALLVFFYFRIPASNNCDWQPDVAVTPYATINGDLVTIHGVRNRDYRTEADFTPRWEARTYGQRPGVFPAHSARVARADAVALKRGTNRTISQNVSAVRHPIAGGLSS